MSIQAITSGLSSRQSGFAGGSVLDIGVLMDIDKHL